MATMLEVSGLYHRYGKGDGAHLAVNDLTFTVETGQLACIVGPSGCGKSTMLRCISGLIKPTGGNVSLQGKPVDGVPEDLAVQPFVVSVADGAQERGVPSALARTR